MDGIKLDERDLRILKILEDDSRTPWRRIAQELGVSESTVYLRVKRLIDEGILEGFTIRVNPRRLGLEAVMFALVKVEAGSIRRIREMLTRIKYVFEVHQVTGEHHFLVKAIAPNRGEAARVIDEIATLPGVTDVKILYSISEVKDGSKIISAMLEWMND